MSSQIQSLIDSYYSFLKEKTRITNNDTGWYTISTPFLGLFNDHIEIYCKLDLENDKILLSDDGETLNNLELVGVHIRQSKDNRRAIFDRICLNYGVKLDKNNRELFLEANKRTFAQKKHNILSAITEILDMYVLSKPNITSMFKEDVCKYLNDLGIVYSREFIITGGETDLNFTFDFQLARKDSEVVIKAFNSLNITNLAKFLFSWQDIKESRERISGKPLKGLAFLNDENNDIKSEHLTAFKNKGADCIHWKERFTDESKQKLQS